VSQVVRAAAWNAKTQIRKWEGGTLQRVRLWLLATNRRSQRRWVAVRRAVWPSGEPEWPPTGSRMKWKPFCATGKGPAEARRVVAVGETGNRRRRVSSTLQCPETQFTGPWGSQVRQIEPRGLLPRLLYDPGAKYTGRQATASVNCRQGTQIKMPTTK
jgi:hypothetical protein